MASAGPASYGLRPTRARRAVVEALRRADDHPDAEALLDRARRIEPKVSLASVYRTLKLLEERGAVVRHEFLGGRSLWELADPEPHAHLVDVQTGEVVEIRQAELRRVLEAAATALGYRLSAVKVELFGVRG